MARELDAWLRADDSSARRVTDWLLGDDEWSPPQAGLLRSVGWLTLTASLAPLVATLAEWRTLEHDPPWARRYCPTCGALPAMGQLLGVDPGRQRFLCCGCCATTWRYGRRRCPFCETESPTAASLAVDGEHGLRIDCCAACGAYLKTYGGHGSESVLLADWTSVHLDLAARDRGWRRAAVSLYDLETSAVSSRPLFRSASGNPEVPSLQ
jgi:FdhE protein